MREMMNKCRRGAGCVNDAQAPQGVLAVLRGCGESMDMVGTVGHPNAETPGHRATDSPPKPKASNRLALGLRHTFALWQRTMALVQSLVVQASYASFRVVS